MSVLVTMSGLQRQNVTGQNFLADLRNYALRFDLIEFGVAAQAGQGTFLDIRRNAIPVDEFFLRARRILKRGLC